MKTKSESHNLQPSKKICKKTCKNKNFSYNNNTHETAFRSEVCPATGDDLTCGFFWNKKIVNVYIDWFNHYHSLLKKINEKWSNRSNEYKRCDLRKLAQSYLSEDEKLNKVYFFTALSERDKPNLLEKDTKRIFRLSEKCERMLFYENLIK